MDGIENLAFLVVLVAWLLRAVVGPAMRRQKEKLKQSQQTGQQGQPVPGPQQGTSQAKPKRPQRTAADILRELGLDPQAPPVQAPPPPPPSPTAPRATGARRPIASAPPTIPNTPPAPPKAPRTGLRLPSTFSRASVPSPSVPKTEAAPADGKLAPAAPVAAIPDTTRLRTARLRKDLFRDLVGGGRPALQRAVILAEVLGPAPGLKAKAERQIP